MKYLVLDEKGTYGMFSEKERAVCLAEFIGAWVEEIREYTDFDEDPLEHALRMVLAQYRRTWDTGQAVEDIRNIMKDQRVE